MKIAPNRSALFSHSHCVVFMVLLYHVISCLRCEGNAPFGYIEKQGAAQKIEIPPSCSVLYTDFLRSFVQRKKQTGVVCCWEYLYFDSGAQEEVLSMQFFHTGKSTSFRVYVPKINPLLWWVE